MNIIFALLIFSVIVTIHELGHFLFAKWNGIEVLEFSVGMGPRILSYQGKETLYSIKLLPLGGSCRMLGEDDLEEEAMDAERAKRSFQAKSVWARFMVVFAGPLFNFILAFVIALFVLGTVGVDKPVVGSVMAGFPASEAGIREGDVIRKINGYPLYTLRDYLLYRMTHAEGSLLLEVSRQEEGGEQLHTFLLEPEYSAENGRKLVGIVWRQENEPIRSFPMLLTYSAHEVYFNIRSTLEGLRAMLTGLIGPDQISGPVGIVSHVGETIQESKPYGLSAVFLSVANMMILLSANLGVMNLLPIPALDGGRIVFYLFEMLTRKRPNKRIEAYVHVAGFAFLMIFMCFIIFNDVYKLVNR